MHILKSFRWIWLLLHSFVIWTEGGKLQDSCPGYHILGEEYEKISYYM